MRSTREVDVPAVLIFARPEPFAFLSGKELRPMARSRPSATLALEPRGGPIYSPLTPFSKCSSVRHPLFLRQNRTQAPRLDPAGAGNLLRHCGDAACSSNR